MIEIDNSLFFSKGTTRQCFIHPDNKNLCIKISLKDQGKRTAGILKAIKRENKFYKYLEKQNISWSNLSRYNGDIDTSIGQGSVYELIRDYDGEISKSLESYLKQDNLTGIHYETLCKKLKNLYVYMQENKVLTTSLLTRNIVVKQSNNDFELVIIDDIGNSEFLAVSQLIPLLGERKIKRKWVRLLKKINVSSENFFI